MSMTETRLGQLIDQPYMIAALKEAAALEGGEVIHEHYSQNQYVNRRSCYLAKHSTSKPNMTGLFPIARRDAQDIFGAECKALSVQEVRRREITLSVLPLLPLPTTANTDTIDSFQSYPPTEWSPLMAYPPLQVPDNPTPGMWYMNRSPTPMSNRASRQQQDIDPADAPTFAPQLAQLGVKAVTEPMTQAANFTKATVPREQTHLPNMPLLLPSSQSTSPRRMSDQPSTQATSPPLPGDREEDTTRSMSHVAQATSDNQALVHQIIAALGTRPNAPRAAARPDHQLSVTVPEGVSSLSSRGMPSVVKTKQGTKRAQEPTPDVAAESEASEVSASRSDTTLPAQKKLKITVKKRPENLPTETGQSPPPKQTKKASSKKSKTSHIERVVAGATLPRTPQEAKAAASTRHTLLLKQHNATEKSRAERARKANKNPDLLPEFFSTKNFPASRKHDQVRCVCGLVQDDGQDMIACDICSVWQHTDCMAEAVPEDVENGKYLCQVCDPYAHRELVAKLRRENPLEE